MHEMEKPEPGTQADAACAAAKEAAVAALVEQITDQWRKEQEQNRAQQDRLRFNLD